MIRTVSNHPPAKLWSVVGDIGGDGVNAVISRTTIAPVFGGLASKAVGGSFQGGAFQAAMVHLFNYELKFDGKTLRAFDGEGKQTNEWPATSGVDGSKPEDSYIRNYGPIPEGKYTVDPSESNYDAWYKFGWGDHCCPVNSK